MVDDIDNCDGDSVFYRTLVSHSIRHSCEKVNFIFFFTLLSFVITFWCAKLFTMFLTLFFCLIFRFRIALQTNLLQQKQKNKNNYRNQESNETLITSSTSSLAQLEKKHQKESGISSISINQNAGSNTINSSKVLSEPSTVETYTNNNQNGYLTLTSSQGPNSFDPATIYSTARSANRHMASNGTLTTTVASTKYNNNNLAASNSGTITSRYNNLYSGVATPSDLYDHQHYQQHRLNSQHQLSQQRHYNNDLDGFYISTSQTPRYRTETIASSSREAITRIIDVDAESIDLSLPQQYEVKIS